MLASLCRKRVFLLALFLVNIASPASYGQAFFDILEIISGTNGNGQSATGYSETDDNYTFSTVPGLGGANGSFTNGPVSGVWAIDMVLHRTIYDGATSQRTSPIAQAPGTTTGSGSSLNRNNAFVYDVSPTQSVSGIEVSLQGDRSTNNEDMTLTYSASPTSLSGSSDDPIPLLSIYPTAPAVRNLPTNQWGYGFNVFNHATRYTPSWDPAQSTCDAFMGEP